MNRRHFTSLALTASAALALPTWVLAQSYPSKPITVIVPFAPGGGSDNVTRLITSALTEKTGKNFIVENRGGAGTNLGNEAAARATPDGYTILLGQFTMSVNPFLYTNLRYNPEKDFTPVVHIASAPTVLIVPASSPFQDLASLTAATKSRPGKLNYGSGGVGTSVHLAAELFESVTKSALVHIPYRGSAPAMNDLVAGRVDMMFDTSTSALPHVKGGRVRALAVAAETRLKELPNTPTFAEAGMKDFVVPAWYGFVAPAGTPTAAVQWLNQEVNQLLKDPNIIARLDAIGAIPAGGTPVQMGEFMKSQSTMWEKVIKDAGIKAE